MKIVFSLLMLIAACVTMAESRISVHAYQKGALARVCLKVEDQDGIVVPDAKVWGGFTSGSKISDYLPVDGRTGENGEYVAQGVCNEFLRFDVTKNGYYHTAEKLFFTKTKADPSVVDGKWQPYGDTRKVVLKKIKHLGQLSVPDVGRLAIREKKIPKFNCWIPFDLERFDWNAPYGTGIHPDVLLRFRNRTTPYYYDYTFCMDVCFTNNPFAGAYEMKKDDTSDMKTVYEADSNAVYRSEFAFTSEKKKGSKRISDYLKEDSYLVFRTRTSVDVKGRLKTAHYGSIHGSWMSGKDHMRLTDGCFNQTENSCVIEDGYYLREAVKWYENSSVQKIGK